MKEDKNKKKLQQALINKALGFTSQEITEEYGLTGDDFVLQKRKTSTKFHPPDLSALQLLLDKEVNEIDDIEQMSDEELCLEKEKLIKLLKEKK